MGLLSTNILSHSIYLIGKGDLNLLFSMGWTMANLKALQSLSSSEVQRMGEMTHVLRPQCIDNELFEKAFSHIKKESEELALQDELLRHGAHASLMQELYGWTTNQTSIRRRMLGMPHQNGRPVSAAENQAVYEAWQASRDETDIRRRLLAVAKATGLPLRSFAQYCLSLAAAETDQAKRRKPKV